MRRPSFAISKTLVICHKFMRSQSQVSRSDVTVKSSKKNDDIYKFFAYQIQLIPLIELIAGSRDRGYS
ncbi:hypothetical protein HCU40_10820 [Pseudanabaena biceps]|nr:hypothetical protein [Pseudanabaena biceps]